MLTSLWIKWNPPPLLVGIKIGAATLENNIEGPQKKKKKRTKLKIELLYDPGIPRLGIYLEKTRTGKDACTLMFIAALFTIARTWKQPKCPSTKEWIKMWYIYTKEYYLAIIGNEMVSFARHG